MTRRGVHVLCVLLALGRAGRGGADPVAFIDFGTGQSRHVRVVGKALRAAQVDGHKVLDLSLGRVSMPMSWPADMPNPTFPGVDEAAKRPAPQFPELVLDIDEKATDLQGAIPAALVITVYDIAEGNSRSAVSTVSYEQIGDKPGVKSLRISVCGDPYAQDVLCRPRLLHKTLALDDLVFKSSIDGGDVKIAPKSRLLIQRVELYRLPKRGLLDESTKALSDLIVAQAHAYADWVDADDAARTVVRHYKWWPKSTEASAVWGCQEAVRQVRTLVHRSQLAADAFHTEGKLALVRQHLETYRRLREDAHRPLRDLAAKARAAQELARRIHAEMRAKLPAASRHARHPSWVTDSVRPSPLDRVLFTSFANSPWDRWDPHNAIGRMFRVFGSKTKGYLLGGPRTNEDGTPDEWSYGYRKSRIAEERALGWDLAPGVGHHGWHLTDRSFPGWLRKKSEEPLFDVDHSGKEGRRGWNIWNSHVRDYFQDVLTTYAGYLRPRPHVVPWFYWGEPACASGYSPSARRAFVEYLRRKYGTLDELNAAWASTYARFDDIQPPPPPGAELRTKASGLTYEFEKFRRDSFTEWWRLAAAALRKGNPDARLWLEGWGRYDYLLRHGMDQLALFDAADISAAHTGSAGQDCQRVWQLSLSRTSGTPMSDGEINIYGPHYNGCATMRELRAAAESHLLAQCWYGVRLFMLWSGQFTMNRVYSYGGPQLNDGSYLASVAPSSLAVRTVRRKADLLDGIIKSTRPVCPRVGLLYSSTSFINSWPYNEVEHETYPMHSWLYHSDFGYWYVHEDGIIDGREDLHDFDVIVAPWAMWLQPEAAEQLLAWVRRGGLLISSGPIGAFDQYGRPLNSILDAALGQVAVRYASHERTDSNRLNESSIQHLRSLGDSMTTHFGGWVWAIDRPVPRPEARTVLALTGGDPVLFEAPVEAGRVLVATGPLGKNGLRRLVMNEVARCVTPLVRKSRDDGFHVLPRLDAQENLYLGVFNQNVSEHVTDTLLVDGHYSEVFDHGLLGDVVVPCKQVGNRTAITIGLAPGEGTVLSLGSMLAANRVPRARRDQPAAPEPEAEVGQKELAPAAQAEAQALLLAASRCRSFGYPDRAKRLTDLARKTTSPGQFTSSPEDEIEAAFADRPVTIDGRADEWRQSKRYRVKSRPNSGGQFAVQWDREHLYVLAVVRDSDLRRTEELGSDVNWMWLYDGVLLVLNPANTAPLTIGGTLYDAKFRAAQTALLVSITGRKYATSPCGFSAAPVRSAVQEIAGGYVMEVTIPLKDAMIPAIAGANIGCELKIVNNGSPLGFARFSDRESWQTDTLHFARLKLIKE